MAPDPAGISNGARIRMYGQGLGDCFLLTFPASEGRDATVNVVIDCGVIAGTPDDALRLQAIVQDIGNATGNHLDLLVVTHEHWDHLSGFLKAREQWQAIDVDRLWLGWTEKDDPDGLPGVLKRILAKHRTALAAVLDHGARLGLEERTQTIRSLMGFMADTPEPGRPFSAAPTVGDALDAARALVPDDDDRDFLEPGEVRRIPGTDVRCFVLGPPRSDTRLRQTDPSRARETYELAAAAGTAEGRWGDGTEPRALAELDQIYTLRAMERSHSQFNAFAMSLLGPDLAVMESSPVAMAALDEGDRFLVAQELVTYEKTFPFDRTFRVPLADADRAAREFPDAYPTLASYIDETNHWRRIDFDWIEPADELALQVDHLTNNTSLVLAFELPGEREEDRKVLLFVGDAQVGNWLSWGDIQAWSGVDAGEDLPETVDINEMMSRVVFYKVGHHGSHNATLKHAVEAMPDDGSLVAYVPVSIPVAHEIKGWTQMPRESLVEALSGRSDEGVLFPSGDVGPGLTARARERKEAAIRYEVSEAMLPAKVRKEKQGPDKPSTEIIEGEVPLWVQVTIPFSGA